MERVVRDPCWYSVAPICDRENCCFGTAIGVAPVAPVPRRYVSDTRTIVDVDRVSLGIVELVVADTLTLVPERARDGQIAVAALFVVLDAGRPRPGTRHLLRGVERALIGRGSGKARRENTNLRIDLADPHLS